MAEKLIKSFFSFEFEVFGKVQGVFFRKYTKTTAEKLSLVGWCKNTEEGTVIGKIQGKKSDCLTMMEWLSKKGSPHSRIDKFEKRNEKDIDKLEFLMFKIDKS